MDEKYDEENKITLTNTGYWGAVGAGCLIFSKTTKRFMIGYRSTGVLEPNTWGTFGGAVDGTASLIDTVKNELLEEIGYIDDKIIDIIPIYIFNGRHNFKYHNFIVVVDVEFTPTLNIEHDDFRWLTIDELIVLDSKHYGLISLLNDADTLALMRKLGG